MIVTIKPIRKVNGWTDGFKFPRFKNTKDSLTAWYDKYGARNTGLTPEQEERIGAYLRKDLSSESPFWDDYRVQLTGKPVILNTSKIEDELKLALLKSHYRIQKSENEPNPRADYVIYNEEIEADNIVTRASVKIKASVLYNNLSLDQKGDVLRLYPGFTRTDNITPSVIEARLYEEMEKDHAKFIRFVEDSDRDTRIFLKDLVSNGLLTKNRNAYKYGDDIIGHNEDAAVEYLNDPTYQSVKVALMKELKQIKSKK